MPDREDIERRLSSLEAAVGEILRRTAPKPTPNWIERITGSFADEPAFDEMIALGRKLRDADRPRDLEE